MFENHRTNDSIDNYQAITLGLVGQKKKLHSQGTLAQILSTDVSISN